MSYFFRPSLMALSVPGYNAGATVILSDAGRQPLSVTNERIEYRTRMANGTMRSKFIADKKTFSTSWEMLPSRSKVGATNVVADGYASATDLERIHNAATGQLSLYLYGDTGQGAALVPSGVLNVYNVFFSSFSSELVKRGKDFDFYNVSISLEQA
jgi:hypothetical protein